MGTLLQFKRKDPLPLIGNEEDEFSDDDIPVAMRIAYIGVSVLCVVSVIAVVALILIAGR